MAKKRVPLHQNPRGYVDVDPDATNGAQVGVNLRGPDGQLLTAAQVINPTTGGSGGPGSIASTIWKLIKEIPLNIQKLAALIGAGFAVRKNDGEWALRTLLEGAGIDIANPDGDAGNPMIGLEDVADSGAGTLLAISKDSKGRVTGSRPATITGTAQQINVANGNAAAGVPTISLSDLPDSGVGAALVKITRDAKGRVSGTQAASTTDLAEGTNLYYTNTRADARIAAQKGQPNGIADLDASGKIPAARLPAIDHNNLSGLQGGTTTERYHLSAVQAASIPASSGTSGQLLRGDGVWSNELLGDYTFRSGSINNSYRKSSLTATISSESLMGLNGYGATGSAEALGGTLNFRAPEPWTPTANGCNFEVRLVAPGTTTLAVRFRVNGDGSVTPASDNAQTLGAAATRWSVVYAGTGSINTSDAREKTPVRPLTPAEIQAATDLGREIGAYKWLASVAEKGDSARWHIGMTVQRAIEVMQAKGLDPFAYGFICHDSWPAREEQWEDIPEIRDADGNVVEGSRRVLVQESMPAGDLYSFRPDGLQAFILRGLVARLDALEQKA